MSSLVAKQSTSSHSVGFDSPPPQWANSVETLPTASEKLWLKCKQTPFVPLGIAGTFATLAYGAYAYRFRGSMSTSRYLMRLRVLAQGAVVCSMIVGAVLTSTSKKHN